MRTMRYQPQGVARLDRRNKFAANALAVLSAAHAVNLATGKPIVAGGSNFQCLGWPAGQALAFRKNFYIESEPLPAIGTASFVEYWVGYPGGSGAQGASDVPSFLTGSSANKSGIFSVRGTGFDSSNGNSASWGAIYQWDSTVSLNSAEDILTPGVFTVLVVVRRQSGMEFWRNGRLVRSITQAPISLPAQTLICGSFIEDGFWTSASDLILAGRVLTPAEPTPAEVRQFSANVWQQFLASHDDGEQAAAAYTLIAATGSFKLNSANARLAVGRRMVASPAALLIAGSPAALQVQRRLPASSVAYGFSGNSTGLVAARRLLATSGTFGASGTAVSLRAGRRLVATAGAFALAGSSIQMAYSPAPGPGGPTYSLTAAPGAFGLVGAVAALQMRRRMLAATGSFVMAGSPVGLLARRRLATAVGGYALQGVSVQVRAARRIAAQAGTFGFAGAAAVLKYTSSGQRFDISKIHPSRLVIFDGSGSRVTPFDGSGSRVTRFK